MSRALWSGEELVTVLKSTSRLFAGCASNSSGCNSEDLSVFLRLSRLLCVLVAPSHSLTSTPVIFYLFIFPSSFFPSVLLGILWSYASSLESKLNPDCRFVGTFPPAKYPKCCITHHSLFPFQFDTFEILQPGNLWASECHFKRMKITPPRQ